MNYDWDIKHNCRYLESDKTTVVRKISLKRRRKKILSTVRHYYSDVGSMVTKNKIKNWPDYFEYTLCRKIVPYFPWFCFWNTKGLWLEGWSTHCLSTIFHRETRCWAREPLFPALALTWRTCQARFLCSLFAPQVHWEESSACRFAGAWLPPATQSFAQMSLRVISDGFFPFIKQYLSQSAWLWLLCLFSCFSSSPLAKL